MALSASAGAPATVAASKAALYENLDLGLHGAYDHATEITWRSLPGREAQEGIAAFLDKRRPAWDSESP
jgi:enoyl-CoA hydratase/carnithine racemase